MDGEDEDDDDVDVEMMTTLSTLVVASHTSCSRAKVVCLQFTFFDSDLRPFGFLEIVVGL